MELSEDVKGLIWAVVVLFVFTTNFKNVVFTMYAYIALNIVRLSLPCGYTEVDSNIGRA